MNYLLAEIKDRKGSIRLILPDITLYRIPDTLDNAIAYSPEDSLQDGEWFFIPDFSLSKYCLEWMCQPFNPSAHAQLTRDEYMKIAYICSFQDNYYFFQRVQKCQLLSRKKLVFGATVAYHAESIEITVNMQPDALYIKSDDALYFNKLTAAAAIFKGMDELYCEATQEDTLAFLHQDFITLGDGFDANSVKKPNRKRIAFAIDCLNGYEIEQRQAVIQSIREYAPGIYSENGQFNINTESDLQALLWGVMQRYFTTVDGREKRIASSIRFLPNII